MLVMETVLIYAYGFVAGLATGLWFWAGSMAERVNTMLAKNSRGPVRVATICADPGCRAGQPDLDPGKYRSRTTI